MFLQSLIYVMAYVVPGFITACVFYRIVYLNETHNGENQFASDDRAGLAVASVFIGAFWPVVVLITLLYTITVKPIKALGKFLERPKR